MKKTERRRRIEEKKVKKRRKTKKGENNESKKIAKEQKNWNKEEVVTKSEEETKKLVFQRFYKWIYIFEKKVSKRMLTKKIQDHMIKVKKVFVLRKRKIYSLLRKEREEMCEFIEEQLRKGYIRFSKLSQIALVFFVILYH